MSKYYIIIVHNGTEVIDASPEVEERIAAMDYMEKRQKRECRHRITGMVNRQGIHCTGLPVYAA